MNKREAERHAAEEAAAIDLGREYYGEEPDLMLCEVARMATSLYSAHDKPKDHAQMFVLGYGTARLQHDEYLAERKR